MNNAMNTPLLSTPLRLCAACLALAVASGCSLKRMAINQVGNALASTGCACEAEDHSDQLGTVGTHPARSVAIAPRCGQIHIFIMGTDHPTGVSATRGVWNNYTLQVTFINDTVSGFYNGAPVLQGAPFSSTGTTLGLYAFDAQGGSPLGGTDSIYF